jgi:hypothetical protein
MDTAINVYLIGLFAAWIGAGTFAICLWLNNRADYKARLEHRIRVMQVSLERPDLKWYGPRS